MKDLRQRLNALSPQQRALLKKQLAGQDCVPPDQMHSIPARESLPVGEFGKSVIFPASFAQQRLWFLDQYEPDSPLYNVSRAVHINGALDVVALEWGLNRLVQRHETLRTNFNIEDGKPVQVIHATQPQRLEVLNLSDLTGDDQLQEIRRLMQMTSAQPFSLNQGPLLRARLLRLGEMAHVLVLTMHHIISDGWSMGVLFRELAICYEAYLQEQEPALPQLPVQYADYAVWQRQWLQGETLERQLAYWRKQLAGLICFELPGDRPRPATQTFCGASYLISVPGPLVTNLRRLGQQHGATLFMTLLAAFQVLLLRHSGQTDITLGSPIAGRNRTELEGLIGFFVNSLVLRSNLSGDPTFTELLDKVRIMALQAYTHQDVPFEKLVEELVAERDLARHPLFQVMFVLHNTPDREWSLPGLEVVQLPPEEATAKFDLTLVLTETRDGLEGFFNYNSDLFDAATIERLADHFCILLQGIVAAPQTRISILPLLSAGERRQLLETWNRTRTDYPRDLAIHSLFEAQVARDPQAVAVVRGEAQLSYGELNARANQLAHHLQHLGVGPETRVGVCLERSLELVVAVLSILKAGGAYVPLDPGYPAERLAFMVHDAGLKLVLSRGRWAQALDVARVLDLDEASAALGRESRENPVAEVNGDNLAYVIYTSGSTGQPKGVMIQHEGVCNLAFALSAAIYSHRCATSVRISLNAPIIFDASVQQWIMLAFGHTLDIVSQDARLDPQAMVAYLQQQRIEVLDCVPSQLKALIQAGLLAQGVHVPSLVLCGGEAIDEATWQTLAAAPDTEFFNVYGPTECTVDSTFCHIRSFPLRPSIGKALANTQLYILDQYLQPVPIGVPGELHIGGPGLARGYLNRPALTAEKFIPHPFSTVPGARLYKTADMARYLPDGNIQYLGRLDHQVKLRGFRIEPGEIEVVLGGHSQVNQAVVLAREDVPGDKRLVAYVVPDKKQPPTLTELRQYLAQRLPDYMIPASFVLLDALPLTPNGKLDPHALPVPEHASVDDEFVAPRTPTEQALSEIWQEVLKLEQVGIHGNFFAMGGHSLLATQVVSRIRNVFNNELPLRILFEQPTIADLAEQIDTRFSKALSSPQISQQAVTRRDGILLSFAQQRLWFLEQFLRGSSAYNIPVAFRIAGPLDAAVLERSLNALVQRHEALRTTFIEEGGQPAQHIHSTLILPLMRVDLCHLDADAQEAQVQQRAQTESLQTFDLASGPLLRAQILSLGEERHVLLLTMHHIIADGWSMGVLFRELATCYEAYCQRREPALPQLPVQYADYAVWQRQWLQGETLDRQLAYWREQLSDITALELPLDRPRPVVQNYRGSMISFTLSPALDHDLRTLGQQQGATLFMTLLAAFQVLLLRHSGQTDITVGSPIAGRNRTELEGLIGFFVNSLVLRSNLSGDPTFTELLDKVRIMALEAYTHQDVPFEKLVEELVAERDLARHPLFQVMFVLQNVPVTQAPFAGLELTPMLVETGITKFDLTLSLTETGDGLEGVFNYDSDLFDAATIERLADHFCILLQGIVAAPQTRISTLPLLSHGERHQLLETWNRTRTDYPRDLAIHSLFEAQVARDPQAVAVVRGEAQLSYGELNARANQLAHHLQHLGVGPETRVGVCLERSLELVVAVLSILKAGGAYVPLDPGYPAERLAFMVHDAGLKLVLSRGRWAQALDVARVLDLDEASAALGRESRENPVAEVNGDNLAYVIYTSGSTGRPKGVMVPQRAVSRLILDTDYLSLQPDDRVAHVSNTSFDAATFELWGALLSGGCLVILNNERVLSPQEFAQDLKMQGISVLFLTTALFQQMARECPGAFNPLRYLLFGGETVDPRWVREVLAHGGPENLLHVYGPTESTTFATWHRVREVPATASNVPIGRPIANTQVYVLDQALQPVPVGVAGELYLGGDGLARGYLNQAALTAERFISHPLSDQTGARLYKTGDRVRLLPDGVIDFLGRFDNQIKLRGFRIEPGEIEIVLGGHSQVNQAVVLVREDVPGDKRLVAYVVPDKKPSPTATQLRQHLKQRLPDYMIPAFFVLLDAFPLTPNGKLDRGALPTPTPAKVGEPRNRVRPFHLLELHLTKIFEHVLGVSPVSVTDNFFELGGHSLLAVKLLDKIHKLLGKKLPLDTLWFHGATVEALAQILGREPGSISGPLLIDIKAQGNKTPLFVVHTMGGNLFHYYDLAKHLDAQQPVLGLQAHGVFGSQPPRSGVQSIAADCIEAMKQRQPQGPYLIAGFSSGGIVAFEVAQQLVAQGESVAMLGLLDTFAPGVYLRGSRRNRLLKTLGLKDLRWLQERLYHQVLCGLGLSRLRQLKSIGEAHRWAHWSYTPQPYPGSVDLFLAASSAQLASDPLLGWMRLAAGNLRIYRFPGSHGLMVKEPVVILLAQQLQGCIDQALGRQTGQG